MAMPAESMDDSTAAYPPRSIYRDLIRRVAVSGTQIRSTLFSHSQSGHGGYSYSSNSGASNSYPSNNSGCSSANSALSAAAADFGTHELKTIASQMVSDGYTQRMVQAFEYGGDLDGAMENRFSELHVAPPEPALVDPVLESWFFELDLAWVLQIGQEHGSEWQLRIQDNSGSSLQDLVQRWIRGLTITVHSITELLSVRHEMTSVIQFGKASILKMLVFVDAIVPDFKPENLRTVLDLYICVRKAMENSKERPELLDLSLIPTLSAYVQILQGAVSSTMEKVKTRIEEDDDSWAIDIMQGGGEVHRNTRWIVDCIVSLDEAHLGGSLSDMVHYLKDLLLRKSKLCSDLSLRYLFLLNNLYFVAEKMNQCKPKYAWKFELGCENYKDRYLNVSWEHVVSCIPKPHVPGPLHYCWINTSSLVKFESAFHKMYQVQKFWKVPDPRLRYFLRIEITERVVSSYFDFLTEHPELAAHVRRTNNTPDVLEEMLGQLFEG